MNVARAIGVAAAVTLGLAAPAWAEAQARVTQARMGAPAEPPGCEKAVKDYVNALRYIKEASGDGIAGRVEKAYLNEAQITQIASEQGACAAAQALKSRGVAVR